MKKLFTLIITVFTLSCGLLHAVENKPGLSLAETFDIYVQSVQNSDLKGLFSTISDNKAFFFLTSTGKLIDTREGYYKFHEEWFAEKNWEMPVDSVEVHEGKDYGYTTAIFHYKAKMQDGGTYILDSYFTLIFHKENGMWKVVADVCTPINRSITEKNSELAYSTDQVYFFDVMKNRRTVRKYKSTPVPREHLLKILDAARMAPTAGNQQPWKFLVIQDKQKITQLKQEALEWYMENYTEKRTPDSEELQTAREATKKILNNILSAPVYVAVMVDSKAKYPDYILFDGSLAAGYLMIAAKALGYGTGFFTTFFPEDKMKELFKIPDNYKLICFSPIGIPEGDVASPPKKALDDFVVFESF